jgi:uncharacterized ferritin-like protein (DUF455 family)
MSHTAPVTLRAFCLGVLTRGDLTSKLAPPPPQLADPLEAPFELETPVRDAAIALTTSAEKLPRPPALHDPAARARCLARFAHHELQAAELFAWALLRWPALPSALRRGLAGVLADEQRHCTLYLERLASLGDSLSDHSRSNYFWRHAKTFASRGPAGFLSAMGLTLEQANLDFSALYRDAFQAAGDLESAAVCDEVHRDEVRHVALAATWVQTLEDRDSDLDAYLASVPFPFAANRAKGRRFDTAAREAAGLSPAFIAHVRAAGNGGKKA